MGIDRDMVRTINSKFEAPNSKQSQMTKIHNKILSTYANEQYGQNFEVLNFGFVSDFDIRIWCLL
jgi:hypothetical protein